MIDALQQRIRRLTRRRFALRACFLGEDGRPTENGAVALAEIRHFCHGDRPTIKSGVRGIDPYASIAAAARQEVWMRLDALLRLDDVDIKRLHEIQNSEE